ncbi:MAG TPA: hypothetical protein IGS37_16305 [Synechococcales cyanobacterium M55_K2018_004]|nr:hypothetical protein [Synechococcales cyanobacterium M55_K2018_004]
MSKYARLSIASFHLKAWYLLGSLANLNLDLSPLIGKDVLEQLSSIPSIPLIRQHFDNALIHLQYPD